MCLESIWQNRSNSIKDLEDVEDGILDGEFFEFKDVIFHTTQGATEWGTNSPCIKVQHGTNHKFNPRRPLWTKQSTAYTMKAIENDIELRSGYVAYAGEMM